MDGLLLTQKESDRFSAWLRHEAESNRVMIRQMEKLLSPSMELLIKKDKTEMVAFLIVADKLDRTERMSIGG